MNLLLILFLFLIAIPALLWTAFRRLKRLQCLIAGLIGAYITFLPLAIGLSNPYGSTEIIRIAGKAWQTGLT